MKYIALFAIIALIAPLAFTAEAEGTAKTLNSCVAACDTDRKAAYDDTTQYDADNKVIAEKDWTAWETCMKHKNPVCDAFYALETPLNTEEAVNWWGHRLWCKLYNSCSLEHTATHLGPEANPDNAHDVWETCMDTCGDNVYEEPIPALNTCLKKCGDTMKKREEDAAAMPISNPTEEDAKVAQLALNLADREAWRFVSGEDSKCILSKSYGFDENCTDLAYSLIKQMDPYWLKRTVECRNTCTDKPIPEYTAAEYDGAGVETKAAVTEFTDAQKKYIKEMVDCENKCYEDDAVVKYYDDKIDAMSNGSILNLSAVLVLLIISALV